MASKKVEKYIVKKGTSLVCKQAVKIIIPKTNFDNNLSEFKDSQIITQGLFKMSSMDGKDNFEVKLPLSIKLNFYDMTSDSDNFYFPYKENDVIIEDMVFIPNVKQASAFLNLLTAGKINTNSFTDTVDVFKKSMSYNKVNINVPSELVECMIAEMARYKNDTTIPFRIAYGTIKGVSESDYMMFNYKDIARMTSVFGAVSFEDIKKSMQSAVFMTRTNQDQTITPTESVLKY